MHIKLNDGSSSINLRLKRVTFVFEDAQERASFINALTADGVGVKNFSYGNPYDAAAGPGPGNASEETIQDEPAKDPA